MNPIEIFLEKPRVFILTLLFILISGTSALNSLPRQENPELAQRWASVQVVFPGASPERIETQVLEPLEAKLREVYEVRRLVSSASDGFSITLVELKEDVDPLLIEDTWSEVQDKIDQAKAMLPNDINTELIRSSGPPATLLYAVKWMGDGPPPKILMTRVANDLRLELAYGGGTDKALLFGGSEEEVLIEIDNAKLSSMGLSFQEISTRLRSMDNKRPIGIFTDQEREILIKSKDNLRTIQEIEDLPIQIFSGNEIIRLSDIANIKKTPRVPSEEMVYVDGQPAILIQVNAAFQQRIDVYVQTLEEIARKYDANLPSELSIIKLYDESYYLTEKFDNLSVSIFFATNTVILLSYFLLGLRSALIVGITIPLTICIVLFGCRLVNLPLHQTSMTGIIIALGLLIDNAIIMVEDYKYRRRIGNSPKNSALMSFQHLWVPLAAATATTAFAFLPVATGKGPSVEFVGGMAVTVILSVCGSLFLALFITPVLLNLMEKLPIFRNQELATEGFSNKKMLQAYQKFLTWSFDKPRRGIFIALIFPTIGFLLFPMLKQDFFPELDRNMFRVSVELPPNSSIEATESEILNLRESIYREAKFKIDTDVWFVGRKLPRILYNVIGGDSPLGNNNVADAFFISENYSDMIDNLPDLARSIVKQNPNLRVIIDKFDSGPPVFSAVEYRILGDDPEILKILGDKLELIINNAPDVFLTRADLSQVSTKFELDFNNSNMLLSGLNTQVLLDEISIATQGIEVGTMLDGNKEIPIRVRGLKYQDLNDSIQYISVPGESSLNYSSSFGELKLTSKATSLGRFEGSKVNTVQGWIWPDKYASSTETYIKEPIESFQKSLPPGYTLNLSGEAESRSESQAQLFSSATIFFVLIVIALISALNSFREAGIILSVAILCTGLAFFGLLVGNANFGFIGLVGAVGLIGLSINDAIVVLSHIKEANEDQKLTKERLIEVVIRSTRHIITTSVTTVGGFLPLLITSVFFKPLAWAMSVGVLGATIIALLYIPSLYVIKEKIV